MITLCLSQRVIILKKEQSVSQKFLEQQLQQCKEQDRILEMIEKTLYKMKEIAEYAAANKLNPIETKELQDEIDRLKEEVALLEQQLRPSQITH